MSKTAVDLQNRYRDCVREAWAELPRLVDTFVARLTQELAVTTHDVEDAVAEVLGFKSYAEFEVVSQVLARVHPYLSDNNPEDAAALESIEPTPAQYEQRGLAWAALQAWGGQGLSALGSLDWRRPPALDRVPYEQLSPEGADAWAVLLQFLEDGSSLREQVLDGFARAASPAATEDAVEQALDLADVLARSVPLEVPELAHAILKARGLYVLSEDELAELWDDQSGYSVEDWALLDRAEDPHVDTHAERLERTDGGVAPVWQLREASVALSPMSLAGYYDDSPTLFGVLTQAPDEARFRVNALEDGPQDYLVPAIHYFGYVRTFADVPAMLRCAPRMPETLDIVSVDEAVRMGCPALAGWYRLDWSQCL